MGIFKKMNKTDNNINKDFHLNRKLIWQKEMHLISCLQLNYYVPQLIYTVIGTKG